MKFKRITKEMINNNNWDYDSFKKLAEDYNIVAKGDFRPENISAEYLFRILKYGSSQMARKGDEYSNELSDYYANLFDHGYIFKRENGKIIIVSMPYGTEDIINRKFTRLKAEFSELSSLKLEFLDKKYKYRTNGDYVLIFYI